MTTSLLLACLLVANPLDAAREHLNHGRYAEAVEAFQSIEPTSAEAALGLSRTYRETGQYNKARTTIDEAIKNFPKNADLYGRRAEIALQTGDLKAAGKAVQQALTIDTEQPAARLVKAELLLESGRIKEASDAYRWFVRFYNATQPTDAETLRYVALGSLRYARWNRVSPIFHFVVNTLCPDMEKDNPSDWRAALISGSLLLEKYNEAQGRPELKRALAMNPRAADVHEELAAVALGLRELEQARQEAELALKTNSNHIGALGTLVDLAIIEGRLPDANEVLKNALAVNPRDQKLLARKIAILILAGKAKFTDLESWLKACERQATPEVDTPLSDLLDPFLARNPRPGPFLGQLGKTFESRRLFNEAERIYRTATSVMPELPGPQISLGLLAMRNGDIVAAKTLFEAAFQADPFNVRVNNVRKVIDLLEGYDEVITDHFIIRYNPAQDRVLADLIAEYLEEIYHELTAEFGFEPPGKTVVEIFSRGQGQSGHQWFSARMVGLPWLHTIGASTGMMLALASPTDSRSFNWAEVVRHEFVHVITLQQTDFRIPHWYTEALAVRAETFPRPASWNELLCERVPAGRIDSLDELNQSFVRPDSSEDWHFAYCQSLLYAEYIDEQFGPETHRAILAGYAAGQLTTENFVAATGVSIEDFEAGYQRSLKKIVAELSPGSTAEEIDEDLKEIIRQAIRDHRAGRTEKAIASLESQLNDESPQPVLVALIGRLKLAAGDAQGAERLFAAARKRHPRDQRWLELQVAALLQIGDDPKLPPLLEELAATDPDDALAAKRLAELAREEDDPRAVRRWTLRALHVTPDDAELHEWLAAACEKLGESDRAALARKHARLLIPNE